MSTPIHTVSKSQVSPLTEKPFSISHSPSKSPPKDTLENTDFVRCSKCISSIVHTFTYPFRYIACFLVQFRIFYWLFSPLEFAYNKIIPILDDIYYSFAKRSEIPEISFSKQRLNELQNIYWKLGKDKWKEGVESIYYKHGAYVFDRGLHGKTVEFGFHRSWNRAVHFLSHQFQKRADARMYLQLHEIACSHFLGNANGTLMGQSKVGVFRNSDDGVQCSFDKSSYPFSPEAKAEFAAVNAEIRQKFGADLTFLREDAQKTTLVYNSMPRAKIEAIYNYFSANLYAEIERARTPDEKLTAICAFARKLEWLHPARDGSSRCNLMTLNFLLTQNGFHPVIMALPYSCNTSTLADWVAYVRKGLNQWEATVSNV